METVASSIGLCWDDRQTRTVHGQDRTVHGQDRTVHGQDRTVYGQDKTVHGQDKTVHGQDRDSPRTRQRQSTDKLETVCTYI
jgi:hypothetical protein